MTDLFSNGGLAALKNFVMPDMLCLFDFDGTLAPLVAEPAAAFLPHAVQHSLHRLQQLAKVGIVTGRSLADLSARLEFHPDYLVGNHGLEGLPGWEQRAAEFAAICAAWRIALANRLAAIDGGIQLEDKHYSLSLHYRHARHPEQAMQALLPMFAQLSPPPRVIAGKFVWNLLPPGASDKGRAVEALINLAQAPRTLYVGDDVTDEDVFILQRDDLMTVRVGHAAYSAAQFFIPDRKTILALLDQLLACLSASVSASDSRLNQQRKAGQR
jgi:trehalose 6-phosphate phosphatase